MMPRPSHPRCRRAPLYSSLSTRAALREARVFANGTETVFLSARGDPLPEVVTLKLVRQLGICAAVVV